MKPVEKKSPKHPAMHKEGESLPPALRNEPKNLPLNLRMEIKKFMHRDPWGFCWELLLAWVSIGAAIFISLWFDRIGVTLLAIVFIATRQNVLALLMHEQTHWLAFRSKWGDRFVNALITYPLLLTIEGYRRTHLSHHNYYFTNRDPDWLRKQGREWTFPQMVAELFRSFFKDITGLSLWKFLKGKNMLTQVSAVPPPELGEVCFPCCSRFLSLVDKNLSLFLIYWFLPLATILQAIVRWGAICEHKYNLINPTLIGSTPLIELKWWESFLLPNLSFTLHIYHHWYPAIPFSKLPNVHKIFKREGLVNEKNTFHGYGEYLNSLILKSVQGKTDEAKPPLTS